MTNGTYGAGGKVMAGDLTNRIALDKAVTVESVNGPAATVIQGQWDPTNRIGPGAILVALVTNGAILNGFTLRSGATRSSGGALDLQSGGGIWCASTNALVTNCVITGNAAAQYGGGAYLGRLQRCTLSTNSGAGSVAWGGGAYGAAATDCTIVGNVARLGGGSAYCTLDRCALIANQVFYSLGGGGAGGAYAGTLNNCYLTRNFTTASSGSGGGAESATLNNCTVVANSAPYGGGTYNCTINNCILWNNFPGDFYAGTATYTCTSTSPPAGAGNFAADPLLLADNLHLRPGSPCRGAGSTNYVSGADFDRQPWQAQPSIGCDEWYPAPVITAKPSAAPGWLPSQCVIAAAVAGQEPFTFAWLKDGVPIAAGLHYSNSASASLLINDVDVPDAGHYCLVASNAFGSASSPIFAFGIHCVGASTTGSSAPYTNWSTAAGTLQDAVEVAQDEDWILATNGVYAAGGKFKTGLGAMTNRVALDKALVLSSMNGPEVTIIEGHWQVGTTNGPTSVRCAWLTNGAVLRGFTLRNGASTADSYSYGAGAWCASTNAVILNCIITNNICSSSGGGVYSGTINNSVLSRNSARTYGGAAYMSTLNNCIVRSNFAFYGAGAYEGTLNNCTVVGNIGDAFNGTGGGTSQSTVRNCIVYYNTSPKGANVSIGPMGSVNYCCTTPLPAGGNGNITNAPLFINLAEGDLHVQTNSPCINSGNNVFAPAGVDLDGNARITGGTVDTGANEVPEPTSVISYAWLAQYGLPLDGSADYSDPDGDQANNFQEWSAGTIPTNSASVLRVVEVFQGTLTVIRWLGVTNRAYFVEVATNQTGPWQFRTVKTNLAGTAGTNSTSLVPSPAAQVYYRVGTFR